MSDLKTVLVHADASPRCGAHLRAGRAITQRLQAQMHALYAVNPIFVDLPLELAAGGAPVLMAAEIDESRLSRARTMSRKVQAEPGLPFEWHEAKGSPIAAFTQQARYADLLVLGQHDEVRRDSGVPADFVESVLIGSGRPAVVLPYVDVVGDDIGRTALVAWKETPEAARAVSAALPFLQRAERVHVATWGADDGPAAPGLDILGYLRAHGVQARLHREREAGSEVGELIQSLAADLSATLMVMGCYGHARSRELVLGGASRTLLRSMAVPVLMSH